MWQIKTFKTQESMHKWINAHIAHYRIVEVFINNGYAVEYRKLRRVY